MIGSIDGGSAGMYQQNRVLGKSGFRFLLSGLVVCLLAGCATPERLASRIMTAPNLQRRANANQFAQHWLSTANGGSNPFHSLTVPVGPPDARLSVLELPAGDYHLDFDSSVEKKKNGKNFFWLKVIARTNDLTEEVAERGTIVVLHGYSVEKETMIPWAFVLAEAGYHVVLVDLRGHGQSTGQTFSGGKYETADLIQLLDFLTAQGHGRSSIGVIGLSLGADLALHWAARDPRVAAVVAIAPYNQPALALRRFAKAMGIPVSDKAVRQATELVAARLDLDWNDWSGEAAVRRLKEPVLFIGGGKDTISPPDEVEMMKDIAPAGSRSLIVPGATHFTVGYWFQEIADPVTSWFQERLPEPTHFASKAPHTRPAPAEADESIDPRSARQPAGD